MLTISPHYNYNVNQPSKVRTAPKFGEVNNQPCQPNPQKIESQGFQELIQGPKRQPSLLHQFGDLIFKPDYWKEDSQQEGEGNPSASSNLSKISFLA